MIRLMLTGLAAGLFFSSTFVLNRAMSLEGGHWYWSAALRYFYMVILLGGGLPVIYQSDVIGGIGVAGSGGSVSDEQCARAALAPCGPGR